MRSLFAPVAARAALASLLTLTLAGACGDDAGDDDDDDVPTPDAGVEGFAIEGLDGPVDVYFDEHGILHARCQTDADCFAVEGYFHAAHRFIQMDLRRRLARGKLSALVIGGEGTIIGDRVFNADTQQRQMMTARDGTPLEERLLEKADPATLEALEAYSRGVNAWLADLAAGRNGAALADEYGFELGVGMALINQDAIQDDWEPLDSVACILPLVDQLTNHAEIDAFAGKVYDALGATIAEDVFPLQPASPSSILPGQVGPLRGRLTRAQRRAVERMKPWRPLFDRVVRAHPGVSLDRGSIGSNNWIVGPERTSTGGALLANDPHLTLSHPAIWYLVHLDAKTSGTGSLHVAGASFAGLPGILLGQNEDIAWGATTTYFDATDVYMEKLTADGTAVEFEGGEVPIMLKEYTFEVAGTDGNKSVVVWFPYVPHHGPITEIDEKAGTALSVRWTGHDADTDVNFFLALSKATSVEDARAALENVTTAGQNFVVADRDGKIGWFPYNRLPTRPWVTTQPSWLPVPGQGDFEWGDPIPYEDLPQAIDPENGFLATANNDMTGALQDGNPANDGFPFIQGYVDEGYRHQRIVERLLERDDHDLASMQSIQADVFSLIGELLTPEILGSVKGIKLDADAQAVADALAAWDFECPTGLDGVDPDSAPDPDTAASARGCAAFHVTWARLRTAVFSDDVLALAPDFNEDERRGQAGALIFALTNPGQLSQDYWDDVSTKAVETQADIVAAVLSSTGGFLREELGEDAEGWLWGRLHTVTLRADLLGQITSNFDSDVFSNDGGLFTVDVANPSRESLDNYSQSAGPSMRFACQTGTAGVDCTIELPGGQRHDRNSDFYDSMMNDWLTNRPVPFLFDVDQVAENAAETVRVEPR
jgi:penicillin G amidase